MARNIVDACGIPDADILYLATGATSAVWEVRAPGQRCALRIAIPNGWEPCCYEAEFAIRERLAAVGGRVARPICTNVDIDAGVDVEWCLDEFVDGHGSAGVPLSISACRDVGELLARLHAMPVEGFGLLQNRRDRLVGNCKTARAGIVDRLEAPWPFAARTLADHPIRTVAPELLARLEPLEPALLALSADDRPASIVHSDLHRGQFILTGERLRALLDFGDAVAGPAAWDIGSFGYFQGWKRAATMLEGYTNDRTARKLLLRAGRLFAIVIALHHAGRSIDVNQPQRLDGAVRYLTDNL